MAGALPLQPGRYASSLETREQMGICRENSAGLHGLDAGLAGEEVISSFRYGVHGVQRKCPSRYNLAGLACERDSD